MLNRGTHVIASFAAAGLAFYMHFGEGMPTDERRRVERWSLEEGIVLRWSSDRTLAMRLIELQAGAEAEGARRRRAPDAS